MPGWLPAGYENIFRKINICGRVWGVPRTLQRRKKNPLETPFKPLLTCHNPN